MTAAAFLLVGTVSAPDAVQASNTGCTASGSVRNCPDVPVDGISYGGGVTTVNITSPSGTTNVNSGVIGISLQRFGVDGADDNTAPSFTTLSYDHDGDGSDDDGDTANITVLATTTAPGTPWLFNGGYVQVNGDGSYTTEGGVTYANDDALAQAISTGAGDAPAAAGSVTINNPDPFDGSEGANFTTTNADGIYAKSRGGNGGDGKCKTILLATWCSDGKDGSDGGTVTVNSNGDITVNGTSVSGQYGIAAISEGGAGGDGGGAFGLFASDAGAGGDGGDGGNVFVTLGTDSAITTYNKGGTGVYAVSKGGNGGGGGSPSGLVALGDDGGDGGNGGNVTVSNNGLITTYGDFAHGIYAASLGAGAGKAGGGGGLIAIGGNGGNATNGGDVTVSHSSSVISTSGDNAAGIFAQSVGGGGGDGGDTGGLIAIGGQAGSGGDGGEVTVTNTGTITTGGDVSSAIFAQSIGGGGGNGGNGGGALFVLGGEGGAGGDGDIVTVNSSGNITTAGDDSHGILAQSIGGGGGNGGNSTSVSAFLGVAIGGSGGAGGDGGNVTVNLADTLEAAPTIQTSGDRSNGVFAQSIGGGGGNGGFAAQGAIGAGASISVAIGGSGANGGLAGTVNINDYAHIITDGVDSDGMVAQSIGGGGGNGGFAVSLSGAAGPGAFAVSVGVGGSGGGGQAGNQVTIDAGGSIHTMGDQSEGLLAQSVGGGGGNGGFSVSVAAAVGQVSGSVAVGVGGFGGDGGGSSAVDVTYGGNITTEGADSDAVVVQSVGGGGGNGGFNVSAAISGSATGGGGIGVGVGGFAGDGGAGSTATADITGNILTSGNGSDGLVVQSVGGGGGNGGFNITGAVSLSGGTGGAIGIGVGGFGGGGGSSSTVDATLTGNAETGGDDATAFLAQSIGGGGGNGGFNITGTVSVSSGSGGAVSLGVGGFGGSGGAGGEVLAAVTGDLSTAGNDSDAFVAQSLGGGGGNGGMNISGAVSLSASSGGALSAGLGGFGGSGGTASDVTASVTGVVTTLGNGSGGVLAQSLGGGGGNGGINVSAALSLSSATSLSGAVGIGGFGGDGGNAGNVLLTRSGNTLTQGNDASGVVAQSLGGGGGNGGVNVSGTISGSAIGSSLGVSLGLGGFGGGGGNAGTVTAAVTGATSTEGDNSTGILAQSLGGSGGNGGLNVSASIALSSQTSASAALGVGGFGGGGGNGSTVDLTVTGNTMTIGAGSDAVIAQSLGGGGGNGGVNVSGNITGSAIGSSLGVSLGLGGFGGDGGNAGTVTAAVTGSTSTEGDDSAGILAQSLGGSGGNGGVNVAGSIALSSQTAGSAALGVGGFGGGGGNGSTVDLTVIGDTMTAGAGSDAIVAQSLGGGGGNGGVNVSGSISGSSIGGSFAVSLGLGGFGAEGGNAGNVTVDVTGSVVAAGYVDPANLEEGVPARIGGGNGILAQSIGGGGGNGGINVSGSLSLATSPNSSGAVSLGVGGFGGGGGNAGTVDLVANGQLIWVHGDGNIGAAAQSIGGGGGNGGINVSVGIAMDGQITAGVGGFGGDGGTGGDVTATVNADIVASGARSTGFLAQSIGGGGGNGAINISGGISASTQSSTPSLVFGIGGFGGSGGSSGDVTAIQSGNVTVTGADAIGVAAQSIAGGGGNGGLNVSGNIALGKDGFAAAIGIGGDGGAGADAGDVTLTSDGNILVDGRGNLDSNDESDDETGGHGILAQSIGGSGGNGGINITGVFAPQAMPLAIGVGGSGDEGGDGGDVTVLRGLNTPGTLSTLGDDMNGITAQSIGGGGGNGGFNIVSNTINTNDSFVAQIAVGGSGDDGGRSGDVTVTHAGNIRTDGKSSEGLFAQSVSGGGGSANFNLALSKASDKATTVDVTIGGTTGDGGIAGDVTVDHDGMILTAGDDSTAIYAQSIAGGGGNTGFDLAMTIGGGNSASFALGQLGGDGGMAGDVSVTSAGTLATAGDRSAGIFAQSIAGGGGGSSATGGGLGIGDYSGGFQMGLRGGSGGSAGNVTVDASGLITTEGEDSHGIHAQSIGGGGGAGGGTLDLIVKEKNSATVGIGGKGGTGGLAGMVDVTSSANIFTFGDGAMGIYAQSIGGGGGTGGYSIAAGWQIGGDAGGGSNVFTANVGGVGGAGARADMVTVDNSGIIVTQGRGAHGINAQSLGGGGGDGGIVLSGTLAGRGRHNSLGINVGGSGGTGGTGNDVTVTNSNLIVTGGEEAAGIRAQSLGGGGGDGGLVAQVNITKGADDSSLGATINVGGEGGEGGTAGDVSVTNTADGVIITEGTNGYGIFAQSIGGGGGNGSSVISANFSGGQSTALVGINIGGAGGDGGHGGHVSVTNAGLIDTSGDGAHGIFAQSIGGGGGNGGLSLATNGVVTSGNSFTPLVSIGGAGGDGADAGNVLVENSGQIITRGDNAHGILAQSIGGQGGNANLGLGIAFNDPASTIIANTLSAVVGALSGGDGGEGGQVTVNHSGDITVFGDGAQAVRAESINGGGGGLVLDFNGITSVPGGDALPLVPGGVPSVATDPVLTILAGSEGRTNSSAGAVTVNITGTIGAAGSNGAGFGIQSIGGGGGTVLLDLDLDDVVSQLALLNSLGGQNGQNNNGANITTAHVGDMVTQGRNTPALMLQSIGGGGGRASLSIDSGLPLESIALNLGGTNGINEAGGNVQHTQTGDIWTLGNYAFGAFAQSTGGGGGLTSFYFGADAPQQALAGIQSFAAVQPLLLPPPVVVGLTLGANGGSGLNGGNVHLNLTGDVITFGNHSPAHFYQSVGGGGGTAVVIGADILNVTLGGTDGAEGDGGDVIIVNDGMAMTQGFRAHGIFLQSVGGGGGAVFNDAGTVNITLRSDNVGDGGTIRLDQTGTVMTIGDEAYGIIAQSIGGGGWIDGAFAGTAGGDGAGGAITLNLDSHVDTAGTDSIAVFAQSLGANGAGDIVINLTADHTIHGGTGNGAGVVFDGGDDNELNNAGTVASRNDQAVLGSFGNETIENTGNLIGDVELDGGTNVINNRLDGFFLSLDRAWLTSTNAPPPGANTYTNEGDHAVFGVDTVGLTDLRGNMVQTDTGNFHIDVDLNNQATDRIDITGFGDFDGTGELLFQSIDKKFDEYVIAQALGGMTDSGFEPFFQLPTVGFDWMVRVDNGTDLVLFADKPLFENLLGGASVDMNVVAMGGGLDDVEAVLGIDDPFNRLINLLRFQPDVDALGEAVATLTPSAAPHVLELEHRRSTAYLDFAADCPFTTPVFRFTTGEGCIWFRGGGGEYRRQSANFSPEIEDRFGAASFGVRVPFSGNWMVGFGLEKGTAESELTRAQEFHSRFEKDWILTHAALGWQTYEGFSIGLTVAGGVGDFEAVRRVDVPGFTEFFTTYDGIVNKQPLFTDRSRTFDGISGLAKGDSGMWSVNSRLRMSYQWGDRFQVRPMLDVDGFYSRIGGYTESGVGLANLTYPEVSDALVSFVPAMEFAFNGHVSERLKLRAYVRPGGMFSLGDQWAIETLFDAAPGGVDPVVIKQGIDDPLFRINAGLQALSTHGVSFSMEYGGAWGDLTEQHDLTGRLTIRY